MGRLALSGAFSLPLVEFLEPGFPHLTSFRASSSFCVLHERRVVWVPLQHFPQKARAAFSREILSSALERESQEIG
jgi:hypothetical protein